MLGLNSLGMSGREASSSSTGQVESLGGVYLATKDAETRLEHRMLSCRVLGGKRDMDPAY